MIWIEWAAIAALPTACLFAVMQEQINEVMRSALVVVHNPLVQIQERFQPIVTALRQWLASQTRNESVNEGDGPIYFVLGGAIYSVLTAIFVAADYGLITQTFVGMGMDDGNAEPVFSTALLCGAVLISSAIFWGLILGDLFGVTHLAPWAKVLSRRMQLSLGIVAFLMIGFTAFLAISGGAWRAGSLIQLARMETEEQSQDTLALENLGADSFQGISLGDEPMPTADSSEIPGMDQSSEWILRLNMMGLAGLSIISAVPSGVGVVIAGKFLLLLMASFCLIFIRLIVFFNEIALALLNAAYNLARSLVALIAGIGNLILGPFRRGNRTEPNAPAAGDPEADQAPAEPEAPQPPQGQNPNQEDPQAGAQGAAGENAGTDEGPQAPDAGFNPFTNQRR